TFMGLPVVADIVDLESINALIVTDMKEPQAIYNKSIETISADRVLILPLLGINSEPQKNKGVEISS
ncbi:MAG: hypothetical protein ISR45_10445, partial [Rhodospirillales bacterium]|nr:hypothetical protein [Rhodospirillales bacterium]